MVRRHRNECHYTPLDTLTPQPHLDGRYTVFGRVIAGLEVVDAINQWDVMKRVRVWDGVAGTQEATR